MPPRSTRQRHHMSLPQERLCGPRACSQVDQQLCESTRRGLHCVSGAKPDVRAGSDMRSNASR